MTATDGGETTATFALAQDVAGGASTDKMGNCVLSGYFDGACGGSQTSALQGAAIAGPVSNVYVFPNPWRPHGPRAGNGSGQTGTDAGGITFANLPPECRIRIYTMSGRLVRDLRHSDAGAAPGLETWDGTTAAGGHAASGVYLYRAESASDGKNGTFMVIR